MTLAFMIPTSEHPFLNRLVGAVSKNNVCHVELVFDDDMCFSIFSDSDLFFHRRTMSNPDYCSISLAVSPTEYSTAYQFCKRCKEEGIRFTNVGMVAAYFQPCPVINTAHSTQSKQTFCSKITTEAMQSARCEEVMDLTPCMTTPSMLFDAVSSSPRRVMHVATSYRQAQISI
jgi:hypothetical protein